MADVPRWTGPIKPAVLRSRAVLASARSAATARPGDGALSGIESGPDGPQIDPRFSRLIARLRRDPRYTAVVEALAADERGGRRRRFGHGTLRVQGKIFAMLSRGRLVVKLPRARVDAMVAAGDGEPFDPGHGRRMKEWLVVTSETASWLALVREAHDFVATGAS